MLKWVDAGCLLTIYNNEWKSAPARSVQLFDQLRTDYGGKGICGTEGQVMQLSKTHLTVTILSNLCVRKTGTKRSL